MTGTLDEKNPVAYNVNGVNQQIFGEITGSSFTPIVPKDYALNDIPGMTPLVTVTLKDSRNNNVVDQRYIKLELSASNDYPFTFSYATNLFCDDLNVLESVDSKDKKVYNFTWDKFKTEVLAKSGNDEIGYITQDEFIKYFVEEGTTTITYNNYAKDAYESGVTLNFAKDNKENVIDWVVSAEQVGEVKANKTVSATIKFENKFRGTITVTLELAVTYADSQIPTLGVADNLIWKDGVMEVYTSNPAAGGTAVYHTNILQGRSNPYMNNLLACAGYYMFLVDPKMPALDADGEPVVDANKKPVYVANPASLAFPAGFTTEYSITAANQKNLTANGIFFDIKNDADGIRMVEDEMTVSMNWNAYLNGEAAGNLATIGTTKFHINKPLYLSTANSEKALVDNSEPVSVSLAGYYTITDAYKNVVFDSKGKNQKLFDFYGISSVTFGPDADITIANNAAGTENVRKPSELKLAITVAGDGKLTYQNTGAMLVDNAYIIVPVTIKHIWGTLTGNIAVPLQKKPDSKN